MKNRFSFCVFASDLFWSNVAQHAKKFGKNVVHTFQIRQFGIDGLESNFVELLLDFHQLEHRGGVTIFPRDKR